jgi:hypothetical protein
MEKYFLLSVGYWNLIGSIVLYLMLNQAFADKVMREWTFIFAYPYDIGKYGSLWLLWAATTNTFYSIINIFAAQWDTEIQTTVIAGNVFIYGSFLILSILAIKNENYGKGNYVNIILFLFWISWALYCLIKL